MSGTLGVVNLSPAHLSRYKDIALLFWKYGRTDVVRHIGVGDDLTAPEAQPAGDGDPLPEQFAKDLEAMGPTYVKLGQVLSGRPDLLPPDYLAALARLHDDVVPFRLPRSSRSSPPSSVSDCRKPSLRLSQSLWRRPLSARCIAPPFGTAAGSW